MNQLLSHETIVKASEGDPEAVAAVIPLCRIYPRLCKNGRADQHGYAGAYCRAADRKSIEISL